MSASFGHCNACGSSVSIPECACGSADVELDGDMHLFNLIKDGYGRGLDAYVSIELHANRPNRLLIKKASGQVVIELEEEDWK